MLRQDAAVSPVIAVILMVAITVVLAATVYVWVSAYSPASTAPPRVVTLSSAGTIQDSNKTYVVASATPGMKFTDLRLTLGGSTLQYANLTSSAPSDNRWCVWNVTTSACDGNAVPSRAMLAGDAIVIQQSTLSGTTLRVIDAASNAIVLALTVG